MHDPLELDNWILEMEEETKGIPPKYSGARPNVSENGSGFHKDAGKRKKDPEKKRKLIKIGIVAAVVAAAIIAAVMIRNVTLQNAYDQCAEMALEGNWKDSIDTFQSLSQINYKASSEFYTFCQALQYYEEGNIEKAYDLLYHMPHRKVTSEQKIKMYEFWPAVRDAYKKKYGDSYEMHASSSSGNKSGSSNAGSGTKNSTSAKRNTTEKKNDEYNASEYDEVDEFYNDYYYDFYDFEEAEQYWDEYH